jgi:ankyrin repeat protein
MDPRLPDKSCTNETPLHAAVQTGNVSVVRYLLARGARKVKDAWGRDQLQRAEVLGKRDVMQAFEDYGWKS